MFELWSKLISACLPFDWAQYLFMKQALLAVVLVTPLFALLGTMVISNRMTFFSDVLGHSALTGIAIGTILGFSDPTWPMIIFAVLLAVAVTLLKDVTQASLDTILGIFFAVVVALGVAVLSKGGQFAKFTSYLIGDVLAVTPSQIVWLAGIFIAAVIYWTAVSNALMLTSVNPVLARSRGVPVLLIEISFSVLLAIIVMFSIRLVGILIINSLLILPAAASRNIARNVRDYTLGAITISLVSGVSGLITSYYLGTSSGATIVLFVAVFYLATAVLKVFQKHLH